MVLQLTLLKALESYQDDCDAIVTRLPGRTKPECIATFCRMRLDESHLAEDVPLEERVASLDQMPFVNTSNVLLGQLQVIMACSFSIPRHPRHCYHLKGSVCGDCVSSFARRFILRSQQLRPVQRLHKCRCGFSLEHCVATVARVPSSSTVQTA
jgi:hypothetical protein